MAAMLQILKVQTCIRNFGFESAPRSTAPTNTTIIPAHRFGGTLKGLVDPRVTDCPHFDFVRLFRVCRAVKCFFFGRCSKGRRCTSCRRLDEFSERIYPPSKHRYSTVIPHAYSDVKPSLGRLSPTQVPVPVPVPIQVIFDWPYGGCTLDLRGSWLDKLVAWCCLRGWGKMERVEFVGCIISYGEPEFPLCLFCNVLVTVGRDTIG